MFVFSATYQPPKNRSLELRIVQQLIRKHYDKQEVAAREMDTDAPLCSRMLTGQAPLDLNRLGCLPWEVKRKLLQKLAAAWLNEWIDNKEAERKVG